MVERPCARPAGDDHHQDRRPEGMQRPGFGIDEQLDDEESCLMKPVRVVLDNRLTV